jgi:hypothetical protein
MDGSRISEQKRVAGPRRLHDDSFFAAKVDGIMRIAGYVRSESGTWHKPHRTAVTTDTLATAVSAEPAQGV